MSLNKSLAGFYAVRKEIYARYGTKVVVSGNLRADHISMQRYFLRNDMEEAVFRRKLRKYLIPMVSGARQTVRALSKGLSPQKRAQ